MGTVLATLADALFCFCCFVGFPSSHCLVTYLPTFLPTNQHPTILLTTYLYFTLTWAVLCFALQRRPSQFLNQPANQPPPLSPTHRYFFHHSIKMLQRQNNAPLLAFSQSALIASCGHHFKAPHLPMSKGGRQSGRQRERKRGGWGWLLMFAIAQ